MEDNTTSATDPDANFYFVFAANHVEKCGDGDYRFKRYGREEAVRVAKGMAKKLKVRMYVLKCDAAFDAPAEVVSTEGAVAK